MSITHKDDLSEINLVLADGSVVSYKIFVTTFLGFGMILIYLIYKELMKLEEDILKTRLKTKQPIK